MVVMVLLDPLLFWLPVLGPIIAGLLGGWIAGSVGTAVVAAILPAVLAGLLLFLAFTYWGLPAVGGFLGLSLYLTLTHLLLIVAAAVGGLLAR